MNGNYTLVISVEEPEGFFGHERNGLVAPVHSCSAFHYI